MDLSIWMIHISCNPCAIHWTLGYTAKDAVWLIDMWSDLMWFCMQAVKQNWHQNTVLKLMAWDEPFVCLDLIGSLRFKSTQFYTFPQRTFLNFFFIFLQKPSWALMKAKIWNATSPMNITWVIHSFEEEGKNDKCHIKFGAILEGVKTDVRNLPLA